MPRFRHRRSFKSAISRILHWCSSPFLSTCRFKTVDPTKPSGNFQASLLGLPCELRLQVYEVVLRLPLNYDADAAKSERAASSRLNRSTTMPNLSLPVMNLTLSCRFIASEVRAMARSLRPSERFAIATFDACLHRQRGNLRIVQAQCLLSDLKVLKAEVEVKAQGCGTCCATSPATVSPYDIGRWVNLRVGPLFYPTGLFHNAWALEEVRIHVRFPDMESMNQESWVMEEFYDGLGYLEKTIARSKNATLSAKFSEGQ